MTPIKTIVIAFAALRLTAPAFAFHSPATLAPSSNARSLGRYNKISTYNSSMPRPLIQLSQSSPDEYDPFNEEDPREQLYQQPTSQPRQEALDPLIASLTRVDETATPSQNTPTTTVPIFGEIPADGNLALLVPAAAIGLLGFIFSIVVAFNSRDAIVQELSAVELPKMEYTPTVIEEGVCRGLCSSQESDLEGLRGFMQGLAK